MKARQIICALGLLIYSLSSTAQVFECIDAKGKKTYAKICPENTVKERELENPALVSPGTSTAMSPEKIRAANAAYEQRRAARQNAGDGAHDKPSAEQPSAQACTDARSRLEAMQTGKQSKRVDPVTGEHVPMEDSQRQATIDMLNEQVSQNCK